MKTVMEKLDEVARHTREESRTPPYAHADGCYYCGGNHPTDCCMSEEREEFYAEIR